MTKQAVAARFEVTWNGGPLLPGYASKSPLADLACETQARAELPWRKPRPKTGGKLRQYTQAERDAVKALRQDGLTLWAIAERLGIPMSTAYNFVKE